MKRFLSLLIVLLLLNCGEKVIDDPWRAGICVQTVNCADDTEISFELIPLGTTFTRNETCVYEPSRTGRQTIKLTGSQICVENGFRYLPKGQSIDTIKLPAGKSCAGEEGGFKPFGNALYNLHIKIGPRRQLKTFVYVDNRHCGFPYDPQCQDKNCKTENFTLRYDVGNNKLYYAAGITDAESLDGFESVVKGEVVNWWEVNNCSDICFEGFDKLPFPVLSRPIQQADDHPELSWQAIDDWKSRLDVFELQRSVNGNSFYTIHTPSIDQERLFTDESVVYKPGETDKDLIQYRIKVKFIDQLVAEFSNVRKFYGRSLGTSNRAGVNSSRPELQLEQNEPNPVRGETKITYNLPRSELTQLKIFNSSGEEVATLVNEIQGPGERTVNFDASELAPGKYVYRLRMARAVQMREMIVE